MGRAQSPGARPARRVGRRAPKEWHGCAAANCPSRCQTRYLMCWMHWCRIPKVLKARIYATCAAGGGPDYRAAVDEAVALCARKDLEKAGLTVAD
jgi:hypothetical protein